MTLPPSGPARADRNGLQAHVQAALAERYRIERSIGRGAMAVVYRATRLDTGEMVAVKVMRPELGYEDGVVERFRIEARAMGRLHHENIVEVRTSGEAGDVLWIEMPLVDGVTLEPLIADGPLDWRRAARFLGQAAGALAYAHASGVIHRDIKPANLLIAAGSDRLLVADFGIARIVGASRLTATGTMVGTPAYMSPEQFAFDREVTPATDQYSLGAVAWQMITGTDPPGADTEEQIGWRNNGRRRIRSLAPECPRALALLVERMIAVNPEDRWADLDVVRRAALEIAATGHAASFPALRSESRISAALRQLLG